MPNTQAGKIVILNEFKVLPFMTVDGHRLKFMITLSEKKNVYYTYINIHLLIMLSPRCQGTIEFKNVHNYEYTFKKFFKYFKIFSYFYEKLSNRLRKRVQFCQSFLGRLTQARDELLERLEHFMLINFGHQANRNECA